MTRAEHVSALSRDIAAHYARVRALRPDSANVMADANLSVAIAHMVQAYGHRVTFDILTRAADAVLRAGNLVSA